MEINDQNLAQLSEVLKQTLNPDATERKKAEVCHVTIILRHQYWVWVTSGYKNSFFISDAFESMRVSPRVQFDATDMCRTRFHGSYR